MKYFITIFICFIVFFIILYKDEIKTANISFIRMDDNDNNVIKTNSYGICIMSEHIQPFCIVVGYGKVIIN